MEVWYAFVGAFAAIALKDLIDTLWYKYQRRKNNKNLEAFLEYLEDEEADDE